MRSDIKIGFTNNGFHINAKLLTFQRITIRIFKKAFSFQIFDFIFLKRRFLFKIFDGQWFG